MRTFTARFIFIGLILSALSACENNDDSSKGFSGASAADLSSVYAYKSSGPWASNLKTCALAQSSDDACTFDTLPLIGMETNTPTIDDVLDRVLVSHDWMGERFEEVLTTLPNEFLQLARSVTAIVIDDDIRPAYYTVSTGAIYLDPNFLWLTVEEASTINPKDDFRSDFSRPLDFRSLNRYVKNNQSAYRFIAPDEASARSLSDIEYLIASLLLHELAHANDFFPPDLHNQLQRSDRPWSAARDIEGSWVSTRLRDAQGLSSQTMYDLAGVMFRGDTATDELKQITAAEAGSEFSSDAASDTYAYSSEREDVAMLFEEAMMYHLFDIERDIAFVTAPESNMALCSDLIVAWGNRMRVATSQVATRAEFVVNELLPEVDSNSLFANIPNTREFQDGLDWCSSLLFEVDSTSTQSKPLLESPSILRLDDQPYYR